MLRVLTLPIMKKMTENVYFAESILSLIDFKRVFDQEVQGLADFASAKGTKARPELISAQDFLTLYKSSQEFRESDSLK